MNFIRTNTEKMKLSVRELRESDIELIVSYFITTTPEFLLGMGADIEKLPDKVEWKTYY